jgi:uncharacterized phage protein (TIGR01671 family)
MNDRFKFRVWCENNKEWETDEICISNKDRYIINQKLFSKDEPKHHIINFCTGLKDKNGKLIYEGDILRSSAVLDGLKPTINVVKWNHHCWIGNGTLTEFILEISEVIGNIYENPELLKECE